MFEALTIEDIAKDLGLSPRSIRRLAKSGDLPVITKPFRGGFNYIVPVQSYLSWKKQRLNRKNENNYLSDFDSLKELQIEWVEWCKKGLLTGKPLSECTAITYERYLNLYWKLQPRRYSKTTLISLDCLRKVLSNIDPKNYSTKKNIYDAIRSFTKYLIAKGLTDLNLSSELQKIRPRRLLPPKRLHCSQDDFEKLLIEAGKRHSGQSDYDVMLNTATIATIVFTGLRASELCSLRLQDIDLTNRRLFVYLGKGKKNRSVGICNRLYSHLVEYLKVRPKTKLEQLFLTKSNTSGKFVSLTRKTLFQKV